MEICRSIDKAVLDVVECQPMRVIVFVILISLRWFKLELAIRDLNPDTLMVRILGAAIQDVSVAFHALLSWKLTAAHY